MDYDRIIIELLSRVSLLEEKVSKLEETRKELSDTPKGSKKYRKLTDYLTEKESAGDSEVRLTFSEIEKILGFELPESKRHRAFWANTESHPIALSWLCTSYRTVEPSVSSETIIWEKRR